MSNSFYNPCAPGNQSSNQRQYELTYTQTEMDSQGASSSLGAGFSFSSSFNGTPENSGQTVSASLNYNQVQLMEKEIHFTSTQRDTVCSRGAREVSYSMSYASPSLEHRQELNIQSGESLAENFVRPSDDGSALRSTPALLNFASNNDCDYRDRGTQCVPGFVDYDHQVADEPEVTTETHNPNFTAEDVRLILLHFGLENEDLNVLIDLPENANRTNLPPVLEQLRLKKEKRAATAAQSTPGLEPQLTKTMSGVDGNSLGSCGGTMTNADETSSAVPQLDDMTANGHPSSNTEEAGEETDERCNQEPQQKHTEIKSSAFGSTNEKGSSPISLGSTYSSVPSASSPNSDQANLTCQDIFSSESRPKKDTGISKSQSSKPVSLNQPEVDCQSALKPPPSATQSLDLHSTQPGSVPIDSTEAKGTKNPNKVVVEHIKRHKVQESVQQPLIPVHQVPKPTLQCLLPGVLDNLSIKCPMSLTGKTLMPQDFTKSILAPGVIPNPLNQKTFKTYLKDKAAGSGDRPTQEMMFDYAASPPKVFPHTCVLCNKEYANMKDWLYHLTGLLHLENSRHLRKQYPKWDGEVEPGPRPAINTYSPKTSTSATGSGSGSESLSSEHHRSPEGRRYKCRGRSSSPQSRFPETSRENKHRSGTSSSSVSPRRRHSPECRRCRRRSRSSSPRSRFPKTSRENKHRSGSSSSSLSLQLHHSPEGRSCRPCSRSPKRQSSKEERPLSPRRDHIGRSPPRRRHETHSRRRRGSGGKSPPRRASERYSPPRRMSGRRSPPRKAGDRWTQPWWTGQRRSPPRSQGRHSSSKQSSPQRKGPNLAESLAKKLLESPAVQSMFDTPEVNALVTSLAPVLLDELEKMSASSSTSTSKGGEHSLSLSPARSKGLPSSPSVLSSSSADRTTETKTIPFKVKLKGVEKHLHSHDITAVVEQHGKTNQVTLYPSTMEATVQFEKEEDAEKLKSLKSISVRGTTLAVVREEVSGPEKLMKHPPKEPASSSVSTHQASNLTTTATTTKAFHPAAESQCDESLPSRAEETPTGSQTTSANDSAEIISNVNKEKVLTSKKNMVSEKTVAETKGLRKFPAEGQKETAKAEQEASLQSKATSPETHPDTGDSKEKPIPESSETKVEDSGVELRDTGVFDVPENTTEPAENTCATPEATASATLKRQTGADMLTESAAETERNSEDVSEPSGSAGPEDQLQIISKLKPWESKARESLEGPRITAESGKASPPTMVKLYGIHKSLTHSEVLSAAENFGKTKSVVLFRIRSEAVVIFERGEDAMKLKMAGSLDVDGSPIARVRVKENISWEEKKIPQSRKLSLPSTPTSESRIDKVLSHLDIMPKGVTTFTEENVRGSEANYILDQQKEKKGAKQMVTKGSKADSPVNHSNIGHSNQGPTPDKPETLTHTPAVAPKATEPARGEVTEVKILAEEVSPMQEAKTPVDTLPKPTARQNIKGTIAKDKSKPAKSTPDLQPALNNLKSRESETKVQEYLELTKNAALEPKDEAKVDKVDDTDEHHQIQEGSLMEVKISAEGNNQETKSTTAPEKTKIAVHEPGVELKDNPKATEPAKGPKTKAKDLTCKAELILPTQEPKTQVDKLPVKKPTTRSKSGSSVHQSTTGNSKQRPTPDKSTSRTQDSAVAPKGAELAKAAATKAKVLVLEEVKMVAGKQTSTVSKPGSLVDLPDTGASKQKPIPDESKTPTQDPVLAPKAAEPAKGAMTKTQVSPMQEAKTQVEKLPFEKPTTRQNIKGTIAKDGSKPIKSTSDLQPDEDNLKSQESLEVPKDIAEVVETANLVVLDSTDKTKLHKADGEPVELGVFQVKDANLEVQVSAEGKEKEVGLNPLAENSFDSPGDNQTPAAKAQLTFTQVQDSALSVAKATPQEPKTKTGTSPSGILGKAAVEAARAAKGKDDDKSPGLVPAKSKTKVQAPMGKLKATEPTKVLACKPEEVSATQKPQPTVGKLPAEKPSTKEGSKPSKSAPDHQCDVKTQKCQESQTDVQEPKDTAEVIQKADVPDLQQKDEGQVNKAGNALDNEPMELGGRGVAVEAMDVGICAEGKGKDKCSVALPENSEDKLKDTQLPTVEINSAVMQTGEDATETIQKEPLTTEMTQEDSISTKDTTKASIPPASCVSAEFPSSVETKATVASASQQITAAAKQKPSAVSSQTIGEMLEHNLSPKDIRCFPPRRISSGWLPEECKQVLISWLPLWYDGVYTERDIADLLFPFGFRQKAVRLYVFPQSYMAFAMMPTMASAFRLLQMSLQYGIYFRGWRLNFQLLRRRGLTTPADFYVYLKKVLKCSTVNEAERTVLITNILPREVRDLRLALKEFAPVRNFMPLLNKLFIEFESVEDAVQFGDWHSRTRQACHHQVILLKKQNVKCEATSPAVETQRVAAPAEVVDKTDECIQKPEEKPAVGKDNAAKNTPAPSTSEALENQSTTQPKATPEISEASVKEPVVGLKDTAEVNKTEHRPGTELGNDPSGEAKALAQPAITELSENPEPDKSESRDKEPIAGLKDTADAEPKSVEAKFLESKEEMVTATKKCDNLAPTEAVSKERTSTDVIVSSKTTLSENQPSSDHSRQDPGPEKSEPCVKEPIAGLKDTAKVYKSETGLAKGHLAEPKVLASEKQTFSTTQKPETASSKRTAMETKNLPGLCGSKVKSVPEISKVSLQGSIVGLKGTVHVDKSAKISKTASSKGQQIKAKVFASKAAVSTMQKLNSPVKQMATKEALPNEETAEAVNAPCKSEASGHLRDTGDSRVKPKPGDSESSAKDHVEGPSIQEQVLSPQAGMVSALRKSDTHVDELAKSGAETAEDPCVLSRPADSENQPHGEPTVLKQESVEEPKDMDTIAEKADVTNQAKTDKAGEEGEPMEVRVSGVHVVEPLEVGICAEGKEEEIKSEAERENPADKLRQSQTQTDETEASVKAPSQVQPRTLSEPESTTQEPEGAPQGQPQAAESTKEAETQRTTTTQRDFAESVTDCRPTLGEKIGKLLKSKKKESLQSTPGYSPKLLITWVSDNGSLTEEDFIELLTPFGYRHKDHYIYVVPQACMAFVLMSTASSVCDIIRANKWDPVMLKGSALDFYSMNDKISMHPFWFYKSMMGLFGYSMKKDNGRLIFIRDISPAETRKLREALSKTGTVKNFLPLLNKVFIEFKTCCAADWLGVWYSLLKQPPGYRIQRLNIPYTSIIAPPPYLPGNSLLDSEEIIEGVAIPSEKKCVPGCSVPPFWMTLRKSPFVFPTISPWFLIPDYWTVRIMYDVMKASHKETIPAIMLTGLPEYGYRHEDVARLVWPYFLEQTLQSLYYNVTVLPLQRRAFVYFPNWTLCCDFVKAHIHAPVFLRGCKIGVHFILQDMNPESSEELMYRSLMKWSNAGVPDPTDLEDRLLCVEVSEVSLGIITFVIEMVASITTFVNFLPLANRICIEMTDASGVAKVMEKYSESSLNAFTEDPYWRKVRHFETLESLKQRLQDSGETSIDPDMMVKIPVKDKLPKIDKSMLKAITVTVGQQRLVHSGGSVSAEKEDQADFMEDNVFSDVCDYDVPSLNEYDFVTVDEVCGDIKGTTFKSQRNSLSSKHVSREGSRSQHSGASFSHQHNSSRSSRGYSRLHSSSSSSSKSTRAYRSSSSSIHSKTSKYTSVTVKSSSSTSSRRAISPSPSMSTQTSSPLHQDLQSPAPKLTGLKEGQVLSSGKGEDRFCTAEHNEMDFKGLYQIQDSVTKDQAATSQTNSDIVQADCSSLVELSEEDSPQAVDSMNNEPKTTEPKTEPQNEQPVSEKGEAMAGENGGPSRRSNQTGKAFKSEIKEESPERQDEKNEKYKTRKKADTTSTEELTGEAVVDSSKEEPTEEPAKARQSYGRRRSARGKTEENERKDLVDDELASNEPTVTTRSTRGRRGRTTEDVLNETTKEMSTPAMRQTPARQCRNTNKTPKTEEKPLQKEKTPIKNTEEVATHESLESVKTKTAISEPTIATRLTRGRMVGRSEDALNETTKKPTRRSLKKQSLSQEESEVGLNRKTLVSSEKADCGNEDKLEEDTPKKILRSTKRKHDDDADEVKGVEKKMASTPRTRCQPGKRTRQMPVRKSLRGKNVSSQEEQEDKKAPTDEPPSSSPRASSSLSKGPSKLSTDRKPEVQLTKSARIANKDATPPGPENQTLKGCVKKEEPGKDRRKRADVKDVRKQRREVVGPESKRSRTQSPSVPADFKLPELKPDDPLGTEFVVPAYFCNLCSVFYQNNAEEPHCNSQTHLDNVEKHYQELEQKSL